VVDTKSLFLFVECMVFSSFIKNFEMSPQSWCVSVDSVNVPQLQAKQMRFRCFPPTSKGEALRGHLRALE
jgi:hypothetical protein